MASEHEPGRFEHLWEAIAQAAAATVVIAILRVVGGIGIIILETDPR